MEWITAPSPVAYPDALSFMEARVAAIRAGQQQEAIWLVEHPPIYTAGASAKSSDLIAPSRFPVYETGRGGQYTYHGPGQRIAYAMLDLKKRYAPKPPDLRHFVFTLEQWIIDTLAAFGVNGERREGRIGIWVANVEGGNVVRDNVKGDTLHGHPAPQPPRLSRTTTAAHEAKIAALGIRVRQGVSYHGIAINVNPDLSHFSGIVPCGIRGHGVTSLAALGIQTDMQTLDAALKVACPFG